MSIRLSGWQPDPAPASLPPSHARSDGPAALTPSLFFETQRLRQKLSGGPKTAEAMALGLYALSAIPIEDAIKEVVSQPQSLRRCGIVFAEVNGNAGRRTEHTLTALGHSSLKWRTPPRDSQVDPRRWAGEVARAISQSHRINHHAMLRAQYAGPEVLKARGRLCDALHHDGWTWNVIERHFGMRMGVAEAAAMAWRERGIQ